MKRNNIAKFRSRRKELRNNLTPAEAAFWKLAKQKGLSGYKFRRQHSIDYFILDFYCATVKVAVELDGQVHNSQEAQLYDEERDHFLKHYGIHVIRFENKLVFDYPDYVVNRILEVIKMVESGT